MLIMPTLLKNIQIENELPKYTWNGDKFIYFMHEVKNDKLTDAIRLLNHKATMGLTLAAGEWILWRLSRETNIITTLNPLEAMWAGLIDKRYPLNWENNNKKDRGLLVEGPIFILNRCLQVGLSRYQEGSYSFSEFVVHIISLARYILPKPHIKTFDNWLSNCLKRSAELFPTQYDVIDIIWNEEKYEGTSYDSSNEHPIPREFYFEPNFDYKTADIQGLLNQFLNSLDPKTNPYLQSPEEMLKQGFQGTPYQYQG